MKKILFFLVSFFLFSHCFCQWQPINGKQRFTNGLGIPTKDTTTTSAADTSMITIRPQDSALWVKYKGGWYKVPRVTTSNPNIFLNGGNSFGTTATLGTTDNNDLKIINNNTNYWTFGKTGTLSNSGVSFDFVGDVTASSSAAITGGAIYPINYLSLPDTNRNVAYNLIGTNNGSLFAQIGSGQYFRQVLMAKDSSIYVTPTYFNSHTTSGSITGNSPTSPSNPYPLTFWNATSHLGYTNGATIDTANGKMYTNNKRLADTTDLANYVPYSSANKAIDFNAKSLKNLFISKTGDTTSKFTFDVSGIPTATTLTVAVPNRSVKIDSITTSTTTAINGLLKGNGSNVGAATAGASNDYLAGSSLSATRNLSTGSIFTYNSSTGAYNLDTTKLGGGGLTGNGSPSGPLMPFGLWSAANSKLSSTTVAYGNFDSVNHNFNFGTTTPQSTYLVNINGAAAATTLNGLTLSQLGASSNMYIGNLNGGNGGAAGTYNMSIGYGGMRVTNSSSQYNIGIGVNNFYTLTSGNNNVAIAPINAAYNISTGVDNTFINNGPISNVSYSTGVGGSTNANYATAIGWNSYSTLNGVSLGYNAGYNNSGNYTNINNNVFVGYEAGQSSIAANNTIIIGNYNQSPTAYASTYNTFIGNNQYLYNVGSYNTVIGAQIQPRTNGSNEVILGDGAGNQKLNIFSTGNAMLGYGNNPTDDATNKLQVNGTAKATAFNSNATQTTVSTGLTAGSIVFSTPFNGSSYKKVIAYCNGVTGTLSTPYTISFTNTPVVTFASAGLTASTLTTTQFNITGVSANSGYVIIEGY